MNTNQLSNLIISIKANIISYLKIISVSIIFGLIYIFFKVPQYESYISLYPNQQDSDTSSIFENISGIVKQMGLIQTGLFQSNIDVGDVIFSRSLHKELVKRKWINQDGHEKTLIELWELREPNFLSSIFGSNLTEKEIFEMGIEEIKSRIWIDENRTGLRTIYVKLEDPNICSQLANYIGEYLRDFISNELKYQAKDNRIFLEERMNEAANSLKVSEEKLKNFQEQYTLAIDNPEIVLKRSRLARKVNIDQEIFLVLVQQLELAKIEELKKRPILNFIDKSDIPLSTRYPRKVLVLFSSILCGLIISSLYALVKEDDFK